MKTYHFFLLFTGAITFSCQSSKVSSTNQQTDSLVNIGGEKDANGCLVAAGYTWSKLKKDCIRPFEDGISLHTLNTTSAYQTAAYALIDTVNKKAEIFVPEEQSSILLQQDSSNLFSNGKFNLTQENFCWTLSLKKTALYQERK